MSNKRHVKEIILLILFLVFSVASISIGALIQNTQNTTTTEASSYCKCDDDDKCYPDGCSRKPKTDDNTFSESRYDNVCGDSSLDPGYRMPDGLIQHFCSEQQPSCCFDIYKYKDDRLCCFQERWTCHPSLCKGASGNGDCGKYWNLPGDWKAYGCVKEGPNGDEIPYWGLPPGLPNGSGEQPQLSPTSTPIPPTMTQTPQQPTPTTQQAQNNQNNSVPTSTPRPNNNQNPYIGNTNPTHASSPNRPSPTVNTEDNFAFNFGNRGDNTTIENGVSNETEPLNQEKSNGEQDGSFTLPPMEIKSLKQIIQETITAETIIQVNQTTEKPLTAAKDVFVTVKSYDQKLESTVENWIFKLRVSIQRILP